MAGKKTKQDRHVIPYEAAKAYKKKIKLAQINVLYGFQRFCQKCGTSGCTTRTGLLVYKVKNKVNFVNQCT